ncbi:probable disease resistance protein At4g27220 [Solanum tuberosum]|uniref:probable disease resistance protein At4g27220 n=1 Tax=Solanum tuberosum TaxID=4113 RepID=UPI00073A0149|nr:PREDICTED: probable disease resistance protein At4g27220 [Solanum tuberosum]
MFVEKVTDCLMQPVARGFGYIFYYQSNIRCMDKESENLKNIRNVAAVMQRGTIEVERYGWCPNLKSRYSLSRSAKKITLKVIEFQNESNKSDTTLADKIRQKAKQEWLFDDVFMVIVNQQPDSKRIEGEITREIGLTLAGNKLWSREDQLRTRLTDQNSHILIILDDFQKTLDLKRLGIPSGSNRKHHNGSSEDIGSGMLSEEKAWILFWQKVGNFVDDPSLLDIAKEVAKE